MRVRSIGPWTDQYRVCTYAGITHKELGYALEKELVKPLKVSVSPSNPYFTEENIIELRKLKAKGLLSVAKDLSLISS